MLDVMNSRNWVTETRAPTSTAACTRPSEAPASPGGAPPRNRGWPSWPTAQARQSPNSRRRNPGLPRDGDGAVADYVGHGVDPRKHLELQPALQERPRRDGGSVQNECQRHHPSMGTTCGFLKTKCVNGAATTTTTHTAVPEEDRRDEAGPDVVLGQLRLLDQSRTHAHLAKYRPNRRMTPAMRTRPHVAGMSNRASTRSSQRWSSR